MKGILKNEDFCCQTNLHPINPQKKDDELMAQIDPSELKVEVVEDKPLKGMWHCGPNAAWVTVTHLPTMMSVRCYHESQWKSRENALACIEMMLDSGYLQTCSFPETLEQRLSEK